MSAFAQNDFSQMLVGKDVGISTGGIGNLNDGEIGIFTPGGTRYTEATADADDKFVVVLGRDSDAGPLKSEVLYKDLVKSVTLTTYSAATQKVDYIGYNTSSGSIEVNNNTLYRATLDIKEHITSNHGGVYVKDLVYKSGASATQADIAIGLAASGTRNFSREANINSSGDKPVEFWAVTDSSTTALTGTGTLTVNKGSNRLTAGTDIDAVLSVGDYIRIDESGGGSPATSDPVYKITALDTTNEVATLDRPYEGASLSAVAVGNGLAITAANAAAGDWGVRIAANIAEFKVGKIGNNLMQYQWDLSVDSDAFGATTVTEDSTAASSGNGTYNQVAAYEWFANGNGGEDFRMGEPVLFSGDLHADSSENYDLITIEYVTEKDNLTHRNINTKQLILAIDNGRDATGPTHYALAGASDDITDVLEDLLEGVPVYNASKSGTALAGGDLALT